MTTYSICPRTVSRNKVSFYKSVFPFKVPNKAETAKQITDSHPHKNTPINNNLNPDILTHTILQGLFFIRSQSTIYDLNKTSKGGCSVTVWSLHIWAALQSLPALPSELPSLWLGPCLLPLRLAPNPWCPQTPISCPRTP